MSSGSRRTPFNEELPKRDGRDGWSGSDARPTIFLDGAHNPVTSRKIQRGDILSLNCFPMVAGYYVALERTLFAETATDEHLRLWDFNCKVTIAARNCWCRATSAPTSPRN